jgi:hypothetical protein
MKPRTLKKRNPIAKKLADPCYHQRIIPVKRPQDVRNSKGVQDYKRAIQEMTEECVN